MRIAKQTRDCRQRSPGQLRQIATRCHGLVRIMRHTARAVLCAAVVLVGAVSFSTAATAHTFTAPRAQSASTDAGRDVVAPVRKPRARAADPAAPSAGGLAEPATATPDNQWSTDEIAKAQSECLRVLARLDVDLEILKPIRKDRCGAPAPVKLKSIGTGRDRIEIQPAATLTCPMVEAVKTWLVDGLQPVAQATFDSRMKSVQNVSSYACRNRYGDANGRLSEHALANALDVAAFTLVNGQSIRLVEHWGPNARKAKARAEARARSEAEAEQSRAQAAANVPADAPTAPRLTPRQQVERAKLELRLAEARLSLSEREGALEAQKRSLGTAQAQVEAARRAPLELDPVATERRTRRSRAARGRDNNRARDVAPPIQNPGRSAVDRARREAARRLARAEQLERIARQRAERVARAERVRARAVTRLQRDVRRAAQRVERAKTRADQARRRVASAEAALASALQSFKRGGARAGADASNAGAPRAGSTDDGTSDGSGPLGPKSRFLRSAFAIACDTFGTVLGPEANAAHEDHFHVDLAARRRSAYCE